MISKAPRPITPIKFSHAPRPITIPQADYKTWCKADLWTIERAILLLLNAETLPSRNGDGRCKSTGEQVIYLMLRSRH